VKDHFLANQERLKMGTSGPTWTSSSVVLCVLVANLFIFTRIVDSSSLDVAGAGSPCYELDADGKEDLTKPQVCS